ncbi:MAG: hypothetical protein ABWZ40_13355 [Caulobacterales bacterium]
MSSFAVKPREILSRIAAGVFGGYAFMWGFAMLCVAVGVFAGVDYDEALTFAYLLAFLVYLTAFCWAFAEASLTRVWIVLAGGGALMTGAAWLIAGNLH